MINISNWPTLDENSLPSLNSVTQQVHQVVQLIALVGKFYISPKADDSHTNLGWSPEQNQFVGHPILQKNPIQFGLDVNHMQLFVLSNNEKLSEFNLIEQTRSAAIAWIQKQLDVLGLDAQQFQYDLHYDIPAHPWKQDANLSAFSKEDYQTFSHIRTIGQWMMEDYQQKFKYAEPVRTWPHHFDTGSYIPLIFKNKTVEQSITIGMAIPDKYSEEYYFYVTHWSRENCLNHDPLPDLPQPWFWNQQDFVGAILKISEVIHLKGPESQFKRCATFIDEAIAASFKILGFKS